LTTPEGGASVEAETPPATAAAAKPGPRDIWSARKRRAMRLFRRVSNSLLIIAGMLLFALIYFWPSIFITIQSGEVGVMYRRFDGGTVTDKLIPEGFHYVPPWDRLYVYNARIQEYHHSMQTLSKEGILIKLEISVRWRPIYELVGLLHKNIGPDYRDKVIKPEIEAALRRIVGKHSVSEIYQNATRVAGKVLEQSLEKAQQNYIDIDEVLVRSVELPKALREQITAKLIESERAETYVHRKRVATQEKERLEIEAEGIKKYHEILSKSLELPGVLQWQAIVATKELAMSDNAKTVIIGRNADGLPIILPK
jgi:regulator of protease activity HflC (stomatin/prohibitin superfamily)